MKRVTLTAPIALCLALIVPQGALAAGGPVPPVQGTYIGVPGSPYRYAAFNARGNTVVKRQTGPGAAGSDLRVSGHYGIPGVDYSGSMTGLSADGRTLILAQLPGNRPPRTTRLLVLATAPVAVRTRITLPGWSTVDAISPDGRWLYLIHYPSSDISKYEVLAYNLPAHRLLAKPIVDPRDHGAMTGFAVNRVTSGDGRWAYTLYFRPSGTPFIHALDTAGRRAVCIDLPSVSSADVGNGHLLLTPGGTTLQVDANGVTQATINTRTFTVSPGAGSSGAGQSAVALVRPVAPTRRGTRGHGDVPWELIVLSIAALGVVAAAGAALAKSRRHPDDGRGRAGATVTDLDPQHTDRGAADKQMPVA
ncbi:MAG: hypothetical protein ACYDHH_17580 [Solirubrobacteraceae bacterium]